MSTRCTIHINDKTANSTITLYRHIDGYPEVTGYELKKVASHCVILNDRKIYRTPIDLANALFHDGTENYQFVDKGTADTQYNNGTDDSEWIYDIDYTFEQCEPILRVYANVACMNGFERGKQIPLSDFKDETIHPESNPAADSEYAAAE